MRWLAVLIMLASLRADAHPARIDRLDDDYYRPEPACPRTASWDKLVRCQFKKLKLEVIHDLPNVKLVAYELGASYAKGSKRLELYFLSGGAWVKSGFYAETNTNSELLSFKSLTTDTYRVELGYASPTWVTLDEITTRPALLKRTYTYICSLVAGCRSVMTSCDVLVHGKAISTFHGIPEWDGKQLAIRGDVRNTNKYCAAPPNVRDPADVE